MEKEKLKTIVITKNNGWYEIQDNLNESVYKEDLEEKNIKYALYLATYKDLSEFYKNVLNKPDIAYNILDWNFFIKVNEESNKINPIKKLEMLKTIIKDNVNLMNIDIELTRFRQLENDESINDDSIKIYLKKSTNSTMPYFETEAFFESMKKINFKFLSLALYDNKLSLNFEIPDKFIEK